MSLLHEHSAGNVTQVSSDASAFRVIGVFSTCTGVGDGNGREICRIRSGDVTGTARSRVPCSTSRTDLVASCRANHGRAMLLLLWKRRRDVGANWNMGNESDRVHG